MKKYEFIRNCFVKRPGVVRERLSFGVSVKFGQCHQLGRSPRRETVLGKMKQGTETGLKNVLAGTQELAATDGNELLVGEKSGRFLYGIGAGTSPSRRKTDSDSDLAESERRGRLCQQSQLNPAMI